MFEAKSINAPVELTLSDSATDSPQFRASLQRNEDQLDELSWILDSLVKSSRECLEHAAKLAESLARLPPSIRRMTELEIFDEKKAPVCLASMMEMVEVIFILQERLIRDLGLRLLIPMVQSVQDDLKEIRELRKGQEKTRDRYESLSNKFGSIPKLKEYPLVREDAFQLYKNRRSYFENLFEYVSRILRFRNGADLFFVDKCLGTLGELKEFIETMNNVIKAMKNPSDKMRNQLGIWQKEVKLIVCKLEKENENALELIKVHYSPDASFKATNGVNKEGYLYKKRQKGIGPSWKKVYIVLKDGMFIQQEQGKHRGYVRVSFEINVLLCEIRQAETDRRNCFEVHTSFRTHCYQAEGEEDMRDWIRVFENAKTFALRTTTEPASLGEIPKTTASFDEDQDEDQANEPQNAIELKRNNTIINSFSSWSFGKFENLPFLNTEETLFVSFALLWCPVKSGEENAQTEGDEGVCFGRLFGTETSLYLSTNVFGINKKVEFKWNEIKDISWKMKDFCGVLTFRLGPGNGSKKNQQGDQIQSVKCKTFLDEQNGYDVIMLLWRNAKLEQPKPTDELKKVIMTTVLSTSSEGEIEGEAEGSSPASQEEIPCECKNHLDKTEINIVIPMEIDNLFELMMGKDSPIFEKLSTVRKYKQIQVGDWKKNAVDGEGEEGRELKFIIPLNHPLVKINETECIEEQKILRKESGRRYIIKQEAQTPEVIYGDSFRMLSQFCLTFHSSGKTRLRAHIGIKWLKSPLVKSMIKNTTLKGLSEYMSQYLAALKEEIKKINPNSTEQVEEQQPIESTEADSNGGDKVGGGGWVKEYLNILVEFYNDFKSKCREILKYCELIDFNRGPLKKLVGVILLVWFLVTLYLFHFYISFSRKMNVGTGGRPMVPLAEREINLRFGDHQKMFLSLTKKKEKIADIKAKSNAFWTRLNSVQYKLDKFQHAIWLADQISICLSNPKINLEDCSKYLIRWRKIKTDNLPS